MFLTVRAKGKITYNHCKLFVKLSLHNPINLSENCFDLSDIKLTNRWQLGALSCCINKMLVVIIFFVRSQHDLTSQHIWLVSIEVWQADIIIWQVMAEILHHRIKLYDPRTSKCLYCLVYTDIFFMNRWRPSTACLQWSIWRGKCCSTTSQRPQITTRNLPCRRVDTTESGGSRDTPTASTGTPSGS